MTVKRVKNSVGIWAFGPNATRFMPGGYHPEAVKEDMPTKVRRVVDGLGDLVDGYEFHTRRGHGGQLRPSHGGLGRLGSVCCGSGTVFHARVRSGFVC